MFRTHHYHRDLTFCMGDGACDHLLLAPSQYTDAFDMMKEVARRLAMMISLNQMAIWEQRKKTIFPYHGKIVWMNL